MLNRVAASTERETKMKTYTQFLYELNALTKVREQKLEEGILKRIKRFITGAASGDARLRLEPGEAPKRTRDGEQPDGSVWETPEGNWGGMYDGKRRYFDERRLAQKYARTGSYLRIEL